MRDAESRLRVGEERLGTREERVEKEELLSGRAFWADRISV
jgi:hypothetical protein